MKCFDCEWLDYVGNMFCQYCIENDYILYTTKEDKELCDMMCGEVEDEEQLWKNFLKIKKKKGQEYKM